MLNESIVITELRGGINISKSKYRRNMRLYMGTAIADPISLRDRTPLGFFQPDYTIEDDVPYTLYNNIIKSIIDTKVNMFRYDKVFPIQITNEQVNFKSKRQCRKYKQFMEPFIKRHNMFEICADAYRDACIFDKGCVLLNPITLKFERLLPWQISILDSEYQYGQLKYALIRYEDFPVTMLNSYKVEAPNRLWVTLEILFNLEEKKIKILIDQSEKRSIPWNNTIPIQFIYDSRPVIGSRTISIVDQLIGYQDQLNEINAIINECFSIPPGMIIVGPTSETINEQELSNRNGTYIGYRPGPNATPLQIQPTKPIDPEYFQVRDQIIQLAYQMTGISQMAQQGLKPMGLDSGKALETMENIEKQHFQCVLEDYIRAQEKLSEYIILCFPEDYKLFPESVKDNITIGEIKKQFVDFKIKLVSLSWLSRDPQVQTQTLLEWSAMGLIPKSYLLELSEFGDLASAYTYGSAYQDCIDHCIEKAIDDDIYELPVYNDLMYVKKDSLIDSIILEMNHQYSIVNDPQDETLLRLGRLLETIKLWDIDKGYLTVDDIDEVAEQQSNGLLSDMNDYGEVPQGQEA